MKHLLYKLLAYSLLVLVWSNVHSIQLKPFIDNLNLPLLVTHAPGSEKIFVVEKTGHVYSFDSSGKGKTLYLDASALITSSGNEQGLLSIAFHPEFAKNGYVFVYYTAKNGDNTLARLTVKSPYASQINLKSLEVLFAQKDPASNHNGGMLVFGPDGYLYIGLGDGGRGGDPWNNAQNLDTLLGKMLRIDVNQPSGYSIPKDNPFVDQENIRPEIWAYGLRNPWRHSFDFDTGDLWVADVGQNKWEEIHFQTATSKGGENYGWRMMEGSHCYDPKKNCQDSKYGKLILPVAEYSHQHGCSVTGGYVYRGNSIKELQGKYIFGDFCTGIIWSIDKNLNFKMQELMKTDTNISSFGEDMSGELYIVDYRGTIYKLVP